MRILKFDQFLNESSDYEIPGVKSTWGGGYEIQVKDITDDEDQEEENKILFKNDNGTSASICYIDSDGELIDPVSIPLDAIELKKDNTGKVNCIVLDPYKKWITLGKNSEAIDFIQLAIQKVPDNPDFRLYLATFYEETGDTDKALESIQHGLKIDNENDQLYFRLGVIFDKMGRKNDSIDAMKTALKLDPKNPSALNYLGYTYADLGQNLDDAEQLIRQALTYKPDDGYIIDSLGWVYYKQGLFSKAMEYLEKAEKLVPEDPTIMEHIGDTHLKLNHPQKAIDYYRRALSKKDSETQELQDKIQELETRGF